MRYTEACDVWCCSSRLPRVIDVTATPLPLVVVNVFQPGMDARTLADTVAMPRTAAVPPTTWPICRFVDVVGAL